MKDESLWILQSQALASGVSAAAEDLAKNPRRCKLVGPMLAAPDAVTGATAAYLEAEDAVAAWMNERCVVDTSAIVSSTALYSSWKDWADYRWPEFPRERVKSQSTRTEVSCSIEWDVRTLLVDILPDRVMRTAFFSWQPPSLGLLAGP